LGRASEILVQKWILEEEEICKREEEKEHMVRIEQLVELEVRKRLAESENKKKILFEKREKRGNRSNKNEEIYNCGNIRCKTSKSGEIIKIKVVNYTQQLLKKLI
jgi:hypothetical protein